MGPAVDVQGAIEEVGFHQAAAAVGTEAANLAVGHLAGRQAGHHSIGKGQRGVDVVDRSGGSAPPGCGQADHGGTGQLQHQVDVMNHQVEHHRHVVGPVGVGAVAAGFQHHHFLIGHHLDQLPEGRIEALDMPHLEQAARLVGGLDEFEGLLLTGGDRFLNQHMHPCFEAGQTDPVVQQGGHSDAHRIHLGQHFSIVRKPTAAKLLGGQLAAGPIRIGHTHQLGVLDQAENPGMVPAHVADADDTHAHRDQGKALD